MASVRKNCLMALRSACCSWSMLLKRSQEGNPFESRRFPKAAVDLFAGGPRREAWPAAGTHIVSQEFLQAPARPRLASSSDAAVGGGATSSSGPRGSQVFLQAAARAAAGGRVEAARALVGGRGRCETARRATVGARAAQVPMPKTSSDY